MKRFDALDYEIMGLKESWDLESTLDMLTCLEMEAKRYYMLEAAQEIFVKMKYKYRVYLTDLMFSGKLSYKTPEEEWEQISLEYGSRPKHHVGSSTHLDAAEFMNHLENDNKASIDVLTLKKWLGCLDPSPTGATVKTCAEEVEAPAADHKTSDHLTKCKYTFQKTERGWDLQYGDAKLLGVKDWVGMNYIKTLLQNRGVQIGVLDLQRITGDGDSGQADCDEDYGTDNVDNSSGGMPAWEIADPTAKVAYRGRLEVIATEIKAARSVGDHTKEDALIKEAQFIQKALLEASFKPKDPELEKNRKRVAKAIDDAIKNIRNLEALCGYNDKPISGHLKRYIKKGSTCSYDIEESKLPDWRY